MVTTCNVWILNLKCLMKASDFYLLLNLFSKGFVTGKRFQPIVSFTKIHCLINCHERATSFHPLLSPSVVLQLNKQTSKANSACRNKQKKDFFIASIAEISEKSEQ